MKKKGKKFNHFLLTIEFAINAQTNNEWTKQIERMDE